MKHSHTRPVSTRAKNRGVTLAELMIVLVVVAILTSIAYPSYTEYIDRSRRQTASAALLENAQFMERAFTQNGTYVLPAGTSLPVTTSPRDAVPIRYDITVASAASTYTLTATPTTEFVDPKCGNLTLDQLGVQASNGTESVNYCWRK
jgi:type IV pilus assembly protein PilE